jgi:hypothetical protein
LFHFQDTFGTGLSWNGIKTVMAAARFGGERAALIQIFAVFPKTAVRQIFNCFKGFHAAGRVAFRLSSNFFAGYPGK